MYDCPKKKILNCRQFSFQTPSQMSPNDTDLIEFLNCASSLKDANARPLSHHEKLAFFINLYHVIITHAYIVLGPPKNGFDWLSYYNTIAYQCCDDVFSLTELEHNVIRAKMTYPSQFLSRFVLPKSSDFGFKLESGDFRINFALNSGSLSMPTTDVPVYKPDSMNEQLNATVREFCQQTVIVHQGSPESKKRTIGSSSSSTNNSGAGGGKVSITLPKLCQWFADDFGNHDGSPSSVLKSLEPYLRPDQRQLLQSCWNERKNSFDWKSLKYHSFVFECRFLTLKKDE